MTYVPMKFDGFGRCIYCGSREGLTGEHIVPYCLGSHDEIKEASCPKCRDETHAFEGYYCSRFFGGLRRIRGIKSRKKPPKDEAFPLWLEYDDRCDLVVWDRSRHPNLFLAPVLHQPAGILVGSEPSTMAEVTYFVGGRNYKDAPTLLSEIAGPGLRKFHVRKRLNLQPFGRLIAKVAHCTAVTKFGIDGFKPYLIDVVLGRDTKFPYLIGAPIQAVEPSDSLHVCDFSTVQLPDGRNLLLCTVQFFCDMAGSPAYCAVTGEVEPEALAAMINSELGNNSETQAR